LLGFLLFFGLFVTGHYNYLLFHTLVEMFAVVVACSIFILAWNSHQYMDNNYLVFIGISYLFVGIIDFLYTLAYTGMGVFAGSDTNLPTQLWIGARYFESISLFVAPFVIGKKLKINLVFAGFCGAFFLLFMSIFYGGIFPDCFTKETGLTAFKIGSEYAICVILLASIYFLFQRRSQFDSWVLKLLTASIAVTIISELSFTFYNDPYALANQIGHFLKLLSFWLIYKAIIQTGIKKPYAILLRNLKQSKDLLEEEKDKARKYFDVAGSMLVIVDASQQVSLINKKGCEILGCPKEEIIGKNWFENFIPERIRENVRATFQKLMGGDVERVRQIESPVLAGNGEERIIAWRNTILKDKAGNAVATLSFGEDITEHKQAEEALKRVKNELTIRNKIVEIFLTIPDEKMYGEMLQVILEAVESKFGIFGYIDEYGTLIIPSMTRDIWEKCQIPDKTIAYPPEEWGGIWGRALAEKRSLFANQGLHVPEGHIPITRVLVVPIIYAGQVIGLLEVANKSTDYTHKDQEFLETIAGKIASILNARLQRDREERERKQTDEALSQARNELEQRVKERTTELDQANEQLRQKIEELMHSEKQLRNSQILLKEKEDGLLEAQRIAHLGNWDWDMLENKLCWSDEVYRIFGVEPQQFGATYDAFLSYVHPDDRKLVKQAVNKSLRDPTEHYDIEHRVVQPDGSQRIVHERGEVTFDKDGKAARMIGTVNDITERKKSDQEVHQLREEYLHIARVAAMGELTASLAHELKQPLAAIRSNAQAAQRFLAKEKPDFGELSEILLDIIKDNRRADDVIGKLRRFMRKSELQITELNINDVIQEIIPLTNSYEVMRNISLEFELDEEALPIAGDRVQIQQVILNLILNASEAVMNKASDFRKIVIRTIQKDAQYVTVAVKDSGPGIDERILGRLFEPFYTTKQDGLGMGLSISRTIIDVLGGNLWAENNSDRGATFYFTVPVFKGDSR